MIEKEGYTVARWLASHGIAAFVSKYRLAREPGSMYRIDVEELQAVQRAIRLVRSRAASWGVDPVGVGMLGFSAGRRALRAGIDALRRGADRERSLQSLHVYAGIGHGFALRPGPASGWIARFADWIAETQRPRPGSAARGVERPEPTQVEIEPATGTWSIRTSTWYREDRSISLVAARASSRLGASRAAKRFLIAAPPRASP